MRAARRISARFERLPIRVRLAGVSALLTFVILCGFAGIVGVLTTRQVRGQFNDEMRSAMDQLVPQVHPVLNRTTQQFALRRR